MKEILLPAIAMGAIGLLLGALLAFASKIFAVEKDERAEAIASVLPGANCGSCGYAGCSAYAEAISKGEAKINLCSPGGQSSTDAIADIMGVKKEIIDVQFAIIRCEGTYSNAPDKYEYEGVLDCVAASRLQGAGHKACSYGCLGYGNCARICKNGAIKMVDGIAVVDRDKCGGCAECVAACPKGLIQIVSKRSKYIVKCCSCDKGAAMKEKCVAGCIGCRLCEKACPAGAIKVDNNHAYIDQSLCTKCGLCVEKCPKKIIVEV